MTTPRLITPRSERADDREALRQIANLGARFSACKRFPQHGDDAAHEAHARARDCDESARSSTSHANVNRMRSRLQTVRNAFEFNVIGHACRARSPYVLPIPSNGATKLDKGDAVTFSGIVGDREGLRQAGLAGPSPAIDGSSS
ncbi:hypothetical protein [Caballeronia calidae]|uniref:hypothetical protein n=1 Tax=Caballeronia calidae TaxID=1777139 RepID=UPI000AE75763|nr:hypothetical protein [Caballeronia calidae]